MLLNPPFRARSLTSCSLSRGGISNLALGHGVQQPRHHKTVGFRTKRPPSPAKKLNCRNAEKNRLVGDGGHGVFSPEAVQTCAEALQDSSNLCRPCQHDQANTSKHETQTTQNKVQEPLKSRGPHLL